MFSVSIFWKLTKKNVAFIKKKLLALRHKTTCTSTVLQREVARARPRGLGIQVSTSSIRQVLNDAGYYWLPRAKKPKYSTKDKNARREFVESVLEMSPAQLKAKLSMAMDGVVLSVPPTDAE